MRSALNLLTLALLCGTVYCLPGPDPGAYYFSKTVWVTEKGASSPAFKKALEVASDDLLIYPSPLERSLEKCCEGNLYLTCQRVDLNFQDFDQMKRNIVVNRISFTFVRQVPPTGLVYKNKKGDEAVFSYNKIKRHLFGNINTNDGREYEIESCHNGHVLKEIDVKNLGSESPKIPKIPMPKSPSEVDATADSTTIVTFSVMFYYTQEFEAETADIEGFVDQIIDITNEGFINSKIPVRVRSFCIEKASLTDSTGELEAFTRMKGSPVATLNTADAATLLVTNAPYCGKAWIAPADRDWSFSVNVKSCIGNFVVGHELGHNFGSHHDIYSATNKNRFYSFGYGHHIERGSHSTGARTILAYHREGYNARVNYYSNPSVTLPLTGTPTGIAGVSNTASVIIQNRFKMASNGDESAVCGKIEEGYTKVFSHDTSGGLFTDKNQVLKFNPTNPNADLFSILYRLEEYRDSKGNFQFRLCYPEIKGIGGKSCNEWIQSSNPTTDSVINGFKPISLAFVKNSINSDWKGLGINIPGYQRSALIDDAPSHSHWFTAIGAFSNWGGQNTIPGPRIKPESSRSPTTKVELFVLPIDGPTTEAPSTSIPTTPTPTTATSGPTTADPTSAITNCDSGWTPFIHTGKCYKYSNQKTNWTQALRLCQSAKINPTSTLASIPDMNTNNFLTTLTKESSWTGGYKNSKGEWGWTDGSSWTFTNWNTGEPNNHGGNEDFVEYRSTGKWNDNSDARDRGALCQYDPTPCSSGWTYLEHTGQCSDDDLKEELEEIKKENENLQEIVTALKTQLDGLSRNLTDLSSNVTEQESTVDFHDTVLTDLFSSSDDFSEHISSFNDSLTSIADSVNDHGTKLDSHHHQIHSVIVKTASNSKKVDNVTQDVVNLKASDRQQETKIQQHDTKIKSLTNQVFNIMELGVLVTGGGTEDVELYNPVSKTSCALPALPEVRSLHSQDGPLLCGGNANTHLKPRQNCMLLNSENGTWIQSHSLPRVYHYHCSWTPASGTGTYLLYDFTSHLVKPDGTVKGAFPLKYKTVHACAIQEGDRVIITGGHSVRTVSVYNENGWVEDLPNLKEGRRGHACTSFISGGEKLIMVGGGIKGLETSEFSDTSEIWTGTEWRFALGKLPYTARDVRMAFIDNRILYLGGWDLKIKHKTILSFNLKTEEWTTEGDMLEGRSAHGLSVVNLNVYKKWCQHK